MSTTRPVIFDYFDFRLFLKEMQAALKAADSKFSHRFIAQKLSITSTGWFANVCNGKISLTPGYRIKLAALFQLDAKQAEYFEALVSYNQAGTPEEREVSLKKLLSFTNLRTKQISRDQFDFYSHWYIAPVRELLFIYDFSGDYQALAQMLNPPISVENARHAIKILRSIGLIQKNEQGVYKPSDPVLEKDPSCASIHWALYMKTNLELAQQAIWKFRKNERSISAGAMTFSESGFRQASEKINECLRALLEISERDTTRDTVYQVNVQMFPVTSRHL